MHCLKGQSQSCTIKFSHLQVRPCHQLVQQKSVEAYNFLLGIVTRATAYHVEKSTKCQFCEVRPLNNEMHVASCSYNENVVIILFQSCSVEELFRLLCTQLSIHDYIDCSYGLFQTSQLSMAVNVCKWQYRSGPTLKLMVSNDTRKVHKQLATCIA